MNERRELSGIQNMAESDGTAQGADGATPLDPDEVEGLIPSHITTRDELNAWEQANILQAQQWVFSRRSAKVLTLRFAVELHIRMFDGTWAWAGRFRRSDKNIGVSWPTIETALQDLLDDVSYWLEHNVYAIDEVGARLHHRLVAIHPFPNGNGRHGRLMTDALFIALDHPLFTWGTASLGASGVARAQYLAALRDADRGNLALLLSFVRS